MKKYIIPLIGLMSLLPVTAKADSPSIVITDTQGRNSTFILENYMFGNFETAPDTKALTFEVSTGFFTYDSEGNRIPDNSSIKPGTVLLTMPIEDLREVAFKGVYADVQTIGAESGLTVDMRSNSLIFTGVGSPFILTVATPDGLVKERIRITEDRTVSLEPYGSGLHIITAGDRTFKIMNR